MQSVVGDWEFEADTNGESSTGTQINRWAPNKHCLIMTHKGSYGSANGIGGWEPSTNEYVETWYGTDGVKVENRFSHISEKVWEGYSITHKPSGGTAKSAIRFEKTADRGVFTAKSDKETYVQRGTLVKKQKP